MAPSRTSQLASTIASSASIVEEYLAKKGLPDLSFDAKNDSQLHHYSEISAQREAILQATEELHALMLGPKGILMSQPVSAPVHTPLIVVIFRFELICCRCDR